MAINKKRINCNLAVFYLVLLMVQFPFFEGVGASPIKAIAMAFAPVICFFRCAYLSSALLLGGLYWLSCFFSAYLNPGFRFSTIAYSGMFVATFILFYNLVYKGAFTLEYFIKLVRWIILAYAGCLVLQQCCVLIGLRYIPLINLLNQGWLSIYKLPSLSLEPSHSARILGALFYVYFKCNQYARGSVIPFKQWFKEEHKWVTIGFLWAMLTMGSGTAYIVLAILSLLFMQRKYMAVAIPLIVTLFFAAPYIENKNMNRATSVLQATMTGDVDNVIAVDASAAVRILPLMNTINVLDLNKKETWLGRGADVSLNAGTYSKTRVVGCINDYGLISYVILLVMIFICCIKLNSLPTIYFVIVLGASVNNVAYSWAIMMLFATQLYFDKKYTRR